MYHMNLVTYPEVRMYLKRIFAAFNAHAPTSPATPNSLADVAECDAFRGGTD